MLIPHGMRSMMKGAAQIINDPQSRHLTAPAGFIPPHTEHFFWSPTSVTLMAFPCPYGGLMVARAFAC